MLARKWAWEALLASDDTQPETVGQIATEVADLRDPEKTQPLDPQPALEARCSLYWLRQAAARRQPIGARLLDEMINLACLVDGHDTRRCMLDEDYIVVGALAPDAGLAVRVGFNLVLNKLQQHAYEGAVDNESPSEAFRRHCAMWELSDIGHNIKEEFDKLMVLNTPSSRHLLPGRASALMQTPVADEAQLLTDLGQFVSDAEAALGAVFLQELVAHAPEDDVRGHSILEQLGERPHKRRRLDGAEGGPPRTPPRRLGEIVAVHDQAAAASPVAIGQAIAAYARGIGSQDRPVPMTDASAERLSRRVREREDFVDRRLYPNENIAPVGGGTAGTPPTGARQGRPMDTAGGAHVGGNGAGPSRPQEGRVVAWTESPGDVPDPRDTPTRRPYRPAEYASPRGTRGRRKTVRWTVEETEHLKRLVAEYGRGNWSTMIAQGTAEGDAIRRRTQVDLKDKWRNMCKMDVSLEEVGAGHGYLGGPHGATGAAPGREGADAPAEVAAAAAADGAAGDAAPGGAAAGDADGGGDTQPATNAEGDDAADDDGAEGGITDAGGAAADGAPTDDGAEDAAATADTAAMQE